MNDFFLNTLLPILGTSLVVTCVVIVLKERTPVTITNLLAATCAMLATFTLSDAHGLALDHWTHLTGLGTYFARISITLAACLHIGAACYGIGKWDRPRQLLLVPGVVIGTALYTVFWLRVRVLPSAEAVLYSGYYPGRPDVAFAMSIARGLVLTWYCAFSLYAYLLVSRRAWFSQTAPRHWWRLLSPLALAFGFACGSGTGLVVIAEALTDHAGYRVNWLEDAYSLTLILCFTSFATVYFRGAIVKPVRYWLDSLRTAGAQLREVQAASGHALDLNSHIDDKLMLIVDYADPNVRREVNAECDREAIPYEDRLVTQAAAMIVTLNPANLMRLRRKGEQALDAVMPEHRDAVAVIAALSDTDVFFFSNAYMVAALACGTEELGIDLRRKPEDWHRRLAAVLARVLERYEQPEGYRAAYQEELKRREYEKQLMARDLGLSEDDLVASTQS